MQTDSPFQWPTRFTHTHIHTAASMYTDTERCIRVSKKEIYEHDKRVGSAAKEGNKKVGQNKNKTRWTAFLPKISPLCSYFYSVWSTPAPIPVPSCTSFPTSFARQLPWLAPKKDRVRWLPFFPCPWFMFGPAPAWLTSRPGIFLVLSLHHVSSTLSFACSWDWSLDKFRPRGQTLSLTLSVDPIFPIPAKPASIPYLWTLDQSIDPSVKRQNCLHEFHTPVLFHFSRFFLYCVTPYGVFFFFLGLPFPNPTRT